MSKENEIKELARLANSKDIRLREQALLAVLNLKDFFNNRDIVITLIQDPSKDISIPIIKKVNEECPGLFSRTLKKVIETSKDEDIRSIAADGIISLKAEKFIDLLLEQIPKEKDILQEKYIKAIIEFMKTNEAHICREILKMFSAEEIETVHVAIKLFTKLPNKQVAMDQLLELLIDMPPFLRMRLLDGVSIEKEIFADLVLEKFSQEKHFIKRNVLLKLAQKLKHPKLAQMFLYELKNSKDWLTKYSSIIALGELHFSPAIPLIESALGDVQLTRAAIKSLGFFADKNLSLKLLTDIEKRKNSEQIDTILAIQQSSDPELLKPLIQLVIKKSLCNSAHKEAQTAIVKILKKHQIKLNEKIIEQIGIKDEDIEKSSEQTDTKLNGLELKMLVE